MFRPSKSAADFDVKRRTLLRRYRDDDHAVDGWMDPLINDAAALLGLDPLAEFAGPDLEDNEVDEEAATA
jgi:hypothetical protein